MKSGYHFIRNLIIVLSVAIIVLLGVIIGAVHHDHTTQQMSQSWHMGIPIKLAKSRNWLSNYQPSNITGHDKNKIKLRRTYITLSKDDGYNPTPLYYTKEHKLAFIGHNYGADFAQLPFYKVYPHHTYEIMAGHPMATTGKPERFDLLHGRPRSDDSLAVVKIINANHLKIWQPRYNKKPLYIGSFKPCHESDKKLFHVSK